MASHTDFLRHRSHHEEVHRSKSQILTLSIFLTFQLQSKQQNMLAEEKPTLSDEILSLEAKLEILDREIEELSQE